MDKIKFNKKQLIIYLCFTFVVAWLMQVGVAVLYQKGLTMVYQCLMAAMMFIPFLGTLISGYKINNMGWKPHIKENIKPILIAWFSPSIMTFIGALLYFLIFPSQFDISGRYIVDMIGIEVLEQMKSQGITYPIYVIISIVSCMTYAPFINMFLALGEEVGWRGFMYPQLKEKFGKKLGWIIGGIIWGCWHWPVIWLIGYEYGMDYFGFPVTGMLLFCFVTAALGIICDWLYEKSHCIWVPSIFHGSFNAAATIPLTVTIMNSGSARLLGSAPNGLISGIPIYIFALLLWLKIPKIKPDNE